MRAFLSWAAAAAACGAVVAAGLLISEAAGLPIGGAAEEPTTVGAGAAAWESSGSGMSLFLMLIYPLAFAIAAHAFKAVRGTPDEHPEADSFVGITAGLATMCAFALPIDVLVTHWQSGWISALGVILLLPAGVLSFRIGKAVRQRALRRTRLGA
jgi:hypothetical protein